MKLKLFPECQRNNYPYVGHVLRVWFEGMPAAIGWPGGGTSREKMWSSCWSSLILSGGQGMFEEKRSNW